jgi:hypothetical protein
MQARQKLLEDRGAKNFGHPEQLMTSKAKDSFPEKRCDFCVELGKSWDGQVNELFASDDLCKQSNRYRTSCFLCDSIRLDGELVCCPEAGMQECYRANAVESR